ncbi:MAG: PAS/PAC sensor-containing diguanylate cyclase/phosphodiesterase [Gammaproteobacteria bacterium]|nr:MAG: PAS/PAC sensor-containing diguanylate cyclase/phosphodiesterase [Gammaproteobacteria bacterium]TND04434.1 MAG: PAS/PAC sensor-containing diguanylate cyclase/phosphodiesterase [Gammaproteobacteria bacterium]
MRWPVVTQTIFGLMLAVILTFLYVKTQAVDMHEHNRKTQLLGQLKQVDASLNGNMLKSRNELLLHYDPLVADINQLKGLLGEIRSGRHAIYGNSSAEIDVEIDEISRLLLDKERLLEEFKSHNAILRNSLHYLPAAGGRLLKKLSARNIPTPLVTMLSDALNDTLSFSILSTPEFAAEVTADIEALRANITRFPNEFVREIQHIGEHAERIVIEKPLVDDLINRLVTMPTVHRFNQLGAAYGRYHEAVVRRTDVFRLYLYVFSVFLVLYICYVMVQLRRKAAELQFTVQELNYQKFALDQHAAVSVADARGRVVYVNNIYSEMSQYPRDELLGQDHRILNAGHHTPEDLAGGFFKEISDTIAGGRVWRGEIKSHKKDGGHYWTDTTIVPFVDNTGRPYQYVSIRYDVTERKLAEEALFEAKERAQTTLQSLGDGVIATDKTGHVEYLNPIAEMLTGWSSGEARGQPLSVIFPIVDEATRVPVEDPIRTIVEKKEIIRFAGDLLLTGRHGKEYAIELTAAPIRDRNTLFIGGVLAFRDVTEMRGMARQMSHQAAHDALTGLVNRREFERRLGQLLKSAKERDVQHALCYVDLDQFKVVNDTCGHMAGDELLRQLATVLKGKVRERDTLARLGGDEFGILLGECSIQRAKEIAEEICRAVNEFRYVWKDQICEIGASIGMVPITRDSDSLAQLLGAADAACYAAKDRGRNRVHVYQENDAEVQRRHGEMLWVPRIVLALSEGRFRLFAQSILPVNGDTDEGDHYEVLVRMVDEQGKLVQPDDFLPAAERYDLMPAIDRWIIRAFFAMYEATYGNSAISRHDTVALNLSGASLNDDKFLDFLFDLISHHSVPPHVLCFEITETVTISNLTKATAFMKELRAKGCRFALDDFGSGLSSFEYLKNLPVDYLKIDGCFVKEMVKDSIDYAMVASINQIGHVMGIQTIAESVEKKMTLDKLAEIGVDFAQGYHIDRPEPLEEYLQKKKRRGLTLIKR